VVGVSAPSRSATPSAAAGTADVVDAFNTVFNTGDVDAIMALMTDDVVFESTGPAPDGLRFEGATAVRKVWVDLFGSTPSPRFDGEEVVVCGDRATVRWLYSWDSATGTRARVRGVDVIRVRDGKVAEKLSYVKG
jgi:ketosteroid isomerase-like protein